MVTIGKFVWVGCPHCSFIFNCSPEFFDHSKVWHPRPEIDKDIYLQCPKCKGTFKPHETTIEPGTMPKKIPDSLPELP